MVAEAVERAPIPEAVATSDNTRRLARRHLRVVPDPVNDLRTDFRPAEAVPQPPPEPAPWTATARQWLDWEILRESYRISQEREVREEEDLRGVPFS